MAESKSITETTQKPETLAERGRKAAVAYLKSRGFEILADDWKCGGPSFIVACDDDGLVFVEVKVSTSIERGFAPEGLTPRKRAQFERAASRFVADHPRHDVFVRMDTIGILVTGPDTAMVKHHVNASADWPDKD